MATTFPTYPATTFEQAVELAIFSSNQLHNIINADATSFVETENGNIPSVRSALIENLYFKTPAITWEEGLSVTVFNQLYTFSGETTGTSLWYAPTATTSNPIVTETSPENDSNWRLYGWDTYSKTELNSTSGASYIGTKTGGNLEDDLGQWLPSTVSIYEMTENPSIIKTRGFYSEEDGGQGTWAATGVTNTSLAGTHVITTACVYSANGYEYKLQISGMGIIDPRCNGAKPVAIRTDAYSVKMDELFPDDDDSFICIGQVINGIQSTYTDIYYKVNANSEAVPSFPKTINFNFAGQTYRLGRDSINVRSRHIYDLGGGSIYNWASASNRTAGNLFDTFAHGSAEIQEKYALVGGDGTSTPSWSSVSCQKFKIINGFIFGDQHPDYTQTDCYSRMGIFLLNPEYFEISDMHIEGFLFDIYADQINRTTTDTDGPLRWSNTYSQVSGVPQHGNFYGGTYTNVVCDRGRLGLVYSRTDWTTWRGGSVLNSYLWAYSGDEVRPEYQLIQSGSGFEISGCNLTVYHGSTDTERWQPADAVIYVDGNGVSIHNNYLEHTPNFVRLSKNAVVHQSAAVLGTLNLDMMAAQYRPVSGWNYVKFDKNCFPYYDDSGNYQFPESWISNYTPFTGVNLMRIGSPTQDFGAFAHGGYDFKYGTYNTEYYNGLPDVDHWRDTKRAKEFLTPYGLQVNSGNIILPFHSPAFGSNICIWIKDLTGNFDASKIVAWNAANIESGSSITDANTWMATGQVIIDYNNGYKLIALQNLRWSFDGLQNWSPSASLYVQVDSATPIILKSVQAFTGGIPFFPSPMDYKPSANTNRIWGSQPSTAVNATTGVRNIGGGLYRVGDVVEPWKRVNRSSSLVSPSVDETNFPSNLSTKVISGGCSLGGQMQKSFTVTVTAQDTTNNSTTVNIDDPSMLPYIVAGQLFYLTGTTTGTTSVAAGSYRVLERVSYTSSSTNPRFYIINGTFGSIGDVLTVDNSKVPAYTFAGGSIRLSSLDANYQTGQSTATAAFNIYADGGSTPTYFIQQASGGDAVYNNVSGGAHRFAGDVALNNSLGFKASVTTTGYAVTLSATGSTATSGTLTLRSGVFSPYVTNTTTLGSSSLTWKDLYLQNAATVVSDIKQKMEISELTDAEIDCATECAKLYRKYKLNAAVTEKGEEFARYHIGTIAQYVVEAFTNAGLDWTKYGVVTYEAWEATEATLDEEGNILSPAQDAGEIYMVRYDELNCFINAGQEARLEKLEKLFMTT